MKTGEGGYALVLVLILLAMGALMITPTLRLAQSSLSATQVHTKILKNQYSRDGAAEYAIWDLVHGTAPARLDDAGQCPAETCTYSITLNGIATDVTITMRTELAASGAQGGESNRIRPTKTVECAENGVDFIDNCSSLPVNFDGMVARYTISLEQVSPDTSVGLTHIYDELPSAFSVRLGTATSTDGSFPEIASAAESDIQGGQKDIVEWILASPVYFQQGEIKVFSFEADVDKSAGRYCNDVFLKMEQTPNEKSGKTAHVIVGTSPPDGCEGGGTFVEKFIDTVVIQPNINTVVTYIANVANLEQSTLQMDSLKDILDSLAKRPV